MTITLAAIQFRAEPFQLAENLRRAGELVAAAASSGAQLALLPELFNTGYSYSTALFNYAEQLDGITAAWMVGGARRLGCYLAGGILERSGDDAYSTMLLAGPDGSLAAYRRRHPFFWERGLCKGGDQPQVVSTALGRVGMLVGADIAYDDSATAYAGQIDLLLLCSTAALLPESTVILPDGRRMPMALFHPAFAGREAQMRHDYYGGVGRRAAALRVPLVHAVQCGAFASPLPAERMSLLHMLRQQPRQLGLRLSHKRARVEAEFAGHSAVFDADGRVLAVQPADEGVVLARCAPHYHSVL
jgi:predicted amidohydrolase